MNELLGIIEQAYEAAKSGHWDQLLSEWSRSDVLAGRCSRYKDRDSSWTFLHQAARVGNMQACRALIARGASAEALTRDEQTPEDVARQHGHLELAAFLRDASMELHFPWTPPSDPDVLPSSNRWSEAAAATARTELFVKHYGRIVRIPMGTPHFVDAFGRVLVGWHGTFNPPCGMDGECLLSNLSAPAVEHPSTSNLTDPIGQPGADRGIDMLHHLSLGVKNVHRSAMFYDPALATLGYVRVWSDIRPGEKGQAVGYGLPGGGDKLALKQVTGSVPAPFPGFHVAFAAPTRRAVEEFYAAALNAGGIDNGPPGLRPNYSPDYYAAFVLDPDGHHLEAVCKSAD